MLAEHERIQRYRFRPTTLNRSFVKIQANQLHFMLPWPHLSRWVGTHVREVKNDVLITLLKYVKRSEHTFSLPVAMGGLQHEQNTRQFQLVCLSRCFEVRFPPQEIASAFEVQRRTSPK